MICKFLNYIFPVIFIFFSFDCCATDLSAEESVVLEKFFREMLKEAEVGYVLFDAKPVCIHGFEAIDRYIGECSSHLTSVILREGAGILKNKKFVDQNLLIHIYNNEDNSISNWKHILFINKNMFLDAVRRNLPLFQYVLGPEVTPEKLLLSLTDPEESFHNVLKDDKTLIGILLGYGTQNSIYASRFEELESAIFSESPPMSRRFTKFDAILPYFTKYSRFPEKHKQMLFLKSTQVNDANREPSYGFSSIEQELMTIRGKIKISSEKLDNLSPPFVFGRLDNNDSDDLIANLEQTQDKIKQLLDSKNFLQETLNIVFPQEKINVFSNNETLLGFKENELKRLPFIIAGNIWDNVDTIQDEYIAGFIEGMKVSDESRELKTPIKHFNYLRELHLRHIRDNLAISDNHFNILNIDKSMVCLTPFKLYYRTTKMCEDDRKCDSFFINSLTQIVVNYTISFPDGELIADTFLRGYPMRINMQDTIPGFAYGLKGMKVGEEREIFIHPSMGYGIFTALQQGMYLKVLVQLVKIMNDKVDHEKNSSFAALEILDLSKELSSLDIMEEKDFVTGSKQMAMASGYEMWQHYKKHTFYTLSQVLGWIDQFRKEKTNPDISSLEDQNLINKLHWNLYH